MASFAGAFAALATSHYVLTKTSASKITLLRTLDTISRSKLDQFSITLVTSGTTAGISGSIDMVAEAGDVFISDMSQTMTRQISVHGEPTGELTLWVSRRRFLTSIGDETALHGLVLKKSSAAASVIGAALNSLAEIAAKVPQSEVDAAASGLVELVARAIVPRLEAAKPLISASPSAPVITIRRYIDRNLRSATLDANSIAKTFGLSRATLYRLFEPIGGVAGYIRKARLDHAYQQIAAIEHSDRRIGQIAYGLGFKNVSSFNRLFQSTYGITPRQARKRAARGPADNVLKAEGGGENSLSKWLAQINAA
ncbi:MULTISPECIES: helix-turn-helix transcriptional regulator [Bradyrhizobium]|uniref:helix-turn-helix transcriptional regulator n=1 Tax=Bradyrhizobium TaxID=374 RepID=UPI001EDB7242|nr:AraC family transcriptional regulator [Bradyrhizobium zhengyangense]MCG2645517.1 AraC family transcriptional regulator [Bradyrhizobium zhengyangense]